MKHIRDAANSLRNALTPSGNQLIKDLERAFAEKPGVLAASREQIDDMLTATDQLIERATPTTTIEGGRLLPEQLVLQIGDWLLRGTTGTRKVAVAGTDGRTEEGKRVFFSRLRINDGRTAVSINRRTGAVALTIAREELNAQGIAPQMLAPKFVASAVDPNEFELDGYTTQRFVVEHNGFVTVAAPFGAHSEAAQNLATAAIDAVIQQANAVDDVN